jgi:hypothetical protein
MQFFLALPVFEEKLNRQLFDQINISRIFGSVFRYPDEPIKKGRIIRPAGYPVHPYYAFLNWHAGYKTIFGHRFEKLNSFFTLIACSPPWS